MFYKVKVKGYVASLIKAEDGISKSYLRGELDIILCTIAF